MSISAIFKIKMYIRFTELAAAAERFGVLTLVKLCERTLVSLVDDAENAEACIDFAQRYNLRRLNQHCHDVLLAHKSTAASAPMMRRSGGAPVV
jgi:hypothetical protein